MEQDNINTQDYWNKCYKENGFYQDNLKESWALFHKFLKRSLPQSKVNILEVACGLAHNAAYMKTLGHNVVATDFSQVAIEGNKKRFSDYKIRFECMDIEKATIAFKNFDFIVGFEILEHFKNPILPLIHIQRSLKKEGSFIFSVPNVTGKLAIWNQHYSYWDYQKTTNRLFKAGFTQVCFCKHDFSKEEIMGVATK